MIGLCLVLSTTLDAQQSAILEKYIQEGLSGNAGLTTRQLDIDKAILALEQAKTLFKPRVDFQMQYTLAAGGRTLPLPIGDLLNPVYATLNQLTQTNDFPAIENTEIQFLPNHFHDTKLHTTLPLYSRELDFNKAIKKELIAVEQSTLATYQQNLTKDIQLAYIQYLQALKVADIYRAALELVKENLRVQEKLVKNDVATPAPVLKAKSEVSNVESSLLDAEHNAQNAAAYFNFLLNKPLDAPVDADPAFYQLPATSPNILLGTGENRRELAQLETSRRALDIQLELRKSWRLPTAGVFLDAGFQGFGFNVFDKQAYALLGAQIEMPVYTARSNTLKIQESTLELRQLEARRSELLKSINLQIKTARTNLETAQKSAAAASTALGYAREYYRLTDRRHREGQAMQLELVDARTQLTAAEIKQSLSIAAVYMRWFELAYALQ